MKSMKTSLIVYFSILILASSLALGFISLRSASDALTDDAEKALTSLVLEGSKLTESRMEIQRKTLETIALYDEVQSMFWVEQQPILQKQLKHIEFHDLGIIRPNGTVNYSNGTTTKLNDADPVMRAIKYAENVINFSVSPKNNEIVLMYATPIKKDGKVVGALLGHKDGDALSKITDDIGFGEEGYAYIINSNGTVIGHPDRDKVLNQYTPIEEVKNDSSHSSVAALFEKILSEKQGISVYSFEGNDLYAGYAPIEGTDWTLVITADEHEVLAAIPTLQINIAIVLSVILIVCIIITYMIGNIVTKPIILATQHAEK